MVVGKVAAAMVEGGEGVAAMGAAVEKEVAVRVVVAMAAVKAEEVMAAETVAEVVETGVGTVAAMAGGRRWRW